MEKIKKEYLLDRTLKTQYEILCGLQDNFSKFLSTGFFAKKRTAKEIYEYIQLMAQAKVSFWSSVYNKWPELDGLDLGSNYRSVYKI